MEIPLDIWLRGDVHATSQVISVATREPGRWTDDDVTAVLVGMLRALEQAKNPEADENRQVAMRGFSWIVNPVRRRRRGDRARAVTRCGHRRTLRRRGARLDRDDSASDGRGTCGDAQHRRDGSLVGQDQDGATGVSAVAQPAGRSRRLSPRRNRTDAAPRQAQNAQAGRGKV